VEAHETWQKPFHLDQRVHFSVQYEPERHGPEIWVKHCVLTVTQGRLYAELEVELERMGGAKCRLALATLAPNSDILSRQEAVFGKQQLSRQRRHEAEGVIVFDLGPWQRQTEAARLQAQVELMSEETEVLLPKIPLTTLDIRIVDAHDRAVDDVSKQVWRVTEHQDEAYHWVEEPSGTRWKKVWGTGRGQDCYLPGRYCVSASRRTSGPEHDNTPIDRSAEFVLDGSRREHKVVVQLVGDTPLAIRAINAETGRPLDNAGVSLFDENGFPIAEGHVDDDGLFVRRHLRPGVYWVMAGRHSWFFLDPEWKTEPERITVEVRRGQENQVDMSLQPAILSPSQVAERWPFAVHGSIVDADGKPVPDVEIRVACGWGTLRPTKSVTTNRDGLYDIHFGPGMYYAEADGVPLQCAIVSARKPGYYEQNLCWHGNLGMASSPPAADRKHDFVGIVYPGKPYRLDLVMLPAARVKGRLLDENGNPAIVSRLYLYGGKLYPASSVLTGTDVAEDGCFEFPGVPLFSYGFQFRKPDSRDDLQTKKLQFAAPGDYEVELRWDRMRDRLTVQLLSYPDETNSAAVMLEMSTPRPDRATRLVVSPDGRRIAYREGPRRVILRSLEDVSIRELAVPQEEFGDIAWLGNSRIVGSGGEDRTALPVVSLDGKRHDPIPLPEGTDILYWRFSPNGRLMAFVGRRELPLGGTEHGLFTVDLETGQVQLLVDGALKTPPAWSPDSAHLAIGAAPGYRRSYPLALVEAGGGEPEFPGVDGVGPAWSPDGRFIAFTTEVARGGSWHAGIPVDGRIAVVELDTGIVTPVTPPGINREGKVAGCTDPVWSPDSQWVVCRYRRTPPSPGASSKWLAETCVARRDGSALLKAFNGYPSVAWTPDSQALVFVEDGELHRFPLDAMAHVNAEKRAHE